MGAKPRRDSKHLDLERIRLALRGVGRHAAGDVTEAATILSRSSRMPSCTLRATRPTTAKSFVITTRLPRRGSGQLGGCQSEPGTYSSFGMSFSSLALRPPICFDRCSVSAPSASVSSASLRHRGAGYVVGARCRQRPVGFHEQNKLNLPALQLCGDVLDGCEFQVHRSPPLPFLPRPPRAPPAGPGRWTARRAVSGRPARMAGRGQRSASALRVAGTRHTSPGCTAGRSCLACQVEYLVAHLTDAVKGV
jgi:hypothetical protein